MKNYKNSAKIILGCIIFNLGLQNVSAVSYENKLQEAFQKLDNFHQEKQEYTAQQFLSAVMETMKEIKTIYNVDEDIIKFYLHLYLASSIKNKFILENDILLLKEYGLNKFGTINKYNESYVKILEQKHEEMSTILYWFTKNQLQNVPQNNLITKQAYDYLQLEHAEDKKKFNSLLTLLSGYFHININNDPNVLQIIDRIIQEKLSRDQHDQQESLKRSTKQLDFITQQQVEIEDLKKQIQSQETLIKDHQDQGQQKDLRIMALEEQLQNLMTGGKVITPVVNTTTVVTPPTKIYTQEEKEKALSNFRTFLSSNKPFGSSQSYWELKNTLFSNTKLKRNTIESFLQDFNNQNTYDEVVQLKSSDGKRNIKNEVDTFLEIVK